MNEYKSSGGQTIDISEHIPPIILESGSIFLKTIPGLKVGDANAHSHPLRKRKHKLIVGDVKWVRVILINGDRPFDSYHNDIARKGTVKIWVSGSIGIDNHHIEIKNDGGELQLTTDRDFLDSPNGSMTHPNRRKYDHAGGIVNVEVLDKKDSTIFKYETPVGDDAVIDRILIWTE